MTLVVTHAFTSAIADGVNAAVVRPTNWNANHTVTGFVEPSIGGTGVANNDANTLTWSGAFAATFTLTAITSVTFPTSGTLATTLGPNLPAVVQGDILYASAANVLSALNDVAVGSVLVSGGVLTAPAWSAAPSLTTSLTVPIVYGGTGVASTLSLVATSGVGAGSDTVIIKRGTAGGTTVATFGTTVAVTVPVVVTSTSANAFAVGRQGSTNPVLNVDASAATVVTGLNIAGTAAGSRTLLSVTSSGTNEGLSIDAKGSGTIRLGATSTGAVEFSRNAVPTASDGAALGTSSLMWSDLFLASGGVINFDAGDVTIVHAANNLQFIGASGGYTFDAKIAPAANDGAPLGDTTHNFSDLFLASGAVINFNAGNYTITHSAGLLTTNGALTIVGAFAGATSIAYSTTLTGTTTNANALAVGRQGATNPVLNVDASAATVVTGLNIAGTAAGSRTLLSVTSSGTNEGLSIDAKGSGTIRLGATSTGAVEFSRNAVPTASDGAALGTTSLMWSDLFLASGAVINFNAGNVTLTHAAGSLTLTGSAAAGFILGSAGSIAGTLTLMAATGSGAPTLAASNGTTSYNFYFPTSLGAVGRPLVSGGAGASHTYDAFTGTGDFVKATSPTLAGTPLTTTAAAGTSTTQIASTAFVTGAIREKLTANRTYYVRTDGSDSNTGLVDSAGGAFLTIQYAVNVVGALDLSIYAVTISVGSGTYTATVALKKLFGSGTCTLSGSSATISTTSANCISADGVGTGWTINGFTLQTTTSGDALYAVNGSIFNVGANMVFGATVGMHVNCNNSSFITFNNNYTISGNANVHWYLDNSAQVIAAGLTITLSGTPAWTAAMAYVTNLSLARVNNNTFSGSATGKRFNVDSNASIFTNGGGVNYLPGNSAGTGTNSGASPWGLYQ